MIIAIDGPAGAGKSTIARLLSRRLKIEYIDSGAFYRSLAYFGFRKWNQVESKEDQIAKELIESPDILEVKWENHTQIMILEKEDISEEIRAPQVTQATRFIANHPKCREYVNEKIRHAAQEYSFVIDGRDIGTVVFPDAKNKFYLDAASKIRAERRAKETKIPLDSQEFVELHQAIIDRDRNDMERETAPLQKAKDAKYIDTSHLSIEEVLNRLEDLTE